MYTVWESIWFEPSSISYYVLRYFTLLLTLLLIIIVPVLLSFFGSFRRSKEMVTQYENILQIVKMKEIHKESTVMGFELYYFHGSWLCKVTKRDVSALPTKCLCMLAKLQCIHLSGFMRHIFPSWSLYLECHYQQSTQCVSENKPRTDICVPRPIQFSVLITSTFSWDPSGVDVSENFVWI